MGAAGRVEPGDSGSGQGGGEQLGQRRSTASGDGHGDSGANQATEAEKAGEVIPWAGGDRDIDPFNPEDVAAFQERDRQAMGMLAPAHQGDISLGFIAGLNIREVADKAAVLATQNNVPVHFTFNGTPATALPGEPATAAVAKWEADYAAEMLSPAGIATNVVYAPPETNFPVVGFTGDPAPVIDPAVFQFLDEIHKDADKLTGADPEVLKATAVDPHAKSIAAHTAKPRVVQTPEEAKQAALQMKKPPAANKPQSKEKRECPYCGKPLERWSATMLKCSTGCGRNIPL